MNFDEIKAAVETGHKASSVLGEVLREIVENHHCPKSYGFEGAGTYIDCGKCVYCLGKELFKID